MSAMDLLQNAAFTCSVSSVLNKDVRQHGKQFIYDGKEDTAWSSNEGRPQWINITFENGQNISTFSFQFQGGFAGSNAKIRVENKAGEIIRDEPFYPEDVNSVQYFKLVNALSEKEAKRVRFHFENSTDFFGRIIVYSLQVYE